MKKKILTTRQMVTIGVLAGICIVLDVAQIGFIPTPTMNFTFMHVPVLIGAILEGPLVGAITGLMFGLISLMKQFTKPTPMSVILMDPIISVGVRVFMGYITAVIFRQLTKRGVGKTISTAVSAFLGSMTNTIGVLGLAWLLHLQQYAKIKNLPVEKVKGLIASIALVNGVPEAFIAVAICVPVALALLKTRGIKTEDRKVAGKIR